MSQNKTINSFFWLLFLFIAVDIVNGAGIVPAIFIRMNSLLLDIFFASLIAIFCKLCLKNMDRIQFFVFLMMIWELCIAFISMNSISASMLYHIISWPLLFCVTYQITKNKNFNLPNLQHIVAVWIIGSIYVVYILRTSTWNDVYRTYYLIFAVPFFMHINKKLKYLYLVAILIIILFTYKRTAFIALVLGIMAYYITYIFVQKKAQKKLFLTIAFLGVLALGYLWIIKYGTNLAVVRRIQRISSDNGSGRFIIWNQLITCFKEQDFIMKWVGNGYEGCKNLLNHSVAAAHNDFIEILLDYGIIGFANIIVFILIILKYLFKYIKSNAISSCGYAYMVIVTFVLMMVSYLTWQSVLMKLVAIYFAYMIAMYKYRYDEIE